jgi:predicted  nucleic acid-binding Zn-ribbon protein
MTEQTHSALRELQEIDQGIVAIERRMVELDDAMLDVDAPAEEMEREVEVTRGRLQEMKLEERRLELSIQDKVTRVERLDERLQGVRNVREESAVRSEIDMVRQALASDEQENLSLLDQIRRLELKLEEQESALEQARSEVEPRRKELEAARTEAEGERDTARARREEFVGQVPERELRLYESIRQGGRRAAVAPLTADGACSSCFGVLPLQSQNEVRHGSSLVRCETCGVILTAPLPEPEPDEAEDEPQPSDEAESTAGADDAEPADAAGSDDAGDEPATGGE